MRRNLERVCSLRDEATHLIFSQVPKDILALFQSCVLNYHKRLVEWFNVSLTNRVSVGMMTIVYDFSPGEFDLQNPILRNTLGRETAQYLAEIQEEIKQGFENLGKPAEFSIDIDYKLALTKKPRHIADIVLSSGSSGAPIGVVEVPKDPSKTHPHRQKEIIVLLNHLFLRPVPTKFGRRKTQRIQKLREAALHLGEGFVDRKLFAEILFALEPNVFGRILLRSIGGK